MIQFLYIYPFLHQNFFFLLIKNDSSTKGITTFDYVFLYRAYADDSTFFLKNLASVKKLLDIFFYYSKQSARKSNFSKSETDSLGSLKGVEVVVCGIKCVNLKVNIIKILKIHQHGNKFLNRNIKHSKRSQKRSSFELSYSEN